MYHILITFSPFFHSCLPLSPLLSPVEHLYFRILLGVFTCGVSTGIVISGDAHVGYVHICI